MYERAYQTASGIISTPYGVFGFGQLSCDEARAVAASQIELISSPRVACDTDADCARAELDTSCNASCGTIISQWYVDEIDQRVAELDAALCSTTPLDCKRALPCPPPVAIECFESKCRAAP
jgi:hypothetical protein